LAAVRPEQHEPGIRPGQARGWAPSQQPHCRTAAQIATAFAASNRPLAARPSGVRRKPLAASPGSSRLCEGQPPAVADLPGLERRHVAALARLVGAGGPIASVTPPPFPPPLNSISSASRTGSTPIPHAPSPAWYFALFLARPSGFLGPAEPGQVSLLHVLWGQTHPASRASKPNRSSLHGRRGPSYGPAGHATWGRGGGAGVASRLRAVLAKRGSGPARGRTSQSWGPLTQVSGSRTDDKRHYPCRAAIVAMPPAMAALPARHCPETAPRRWKLQREIGRWALRQNAGGVTSPLVAKLGLSGIASV